MAKVKYPVMLIVLDGWGHSDETRYNAIHSANTPVWDKLWSDCPHVLIRCSGTDVGLPDRQMGNSEVGHMHIGAGRLVDQDYSRIEQAISRGEFAHNEVLVEACRKASETDRAVHILGLASPGGVHSHEDHILALMDLAHAQGARSVYVHAFLDGRDTPPKSARRSLEKIQRHGAALGNARVASITGRYYAMDRNKNWDRTLPAYETVVSGDAEFRASDPVAALGMAYARDETDEFVRATVILDKDGATHRVDDGDVIIFANFRADRARQLTAALTRVDFDHFNRSRLPGLGAFVTLTDYGDQFDLPIAFPAMALPNTLGAVLADHQLRQLRIAETEKYAHVTFFFNGGEEGVFEGEDRILIPSPDVATYDMKPEMSAVEVTEALTAALASREYDVIICNFANADMVGHTGNFDATVRSIECLDICIGRLVDAARKQGIEILITADHGNAEQMRSPVTADGHGDPHTAHTSNRVPFVYIGRKAEIATDGSLCDIAPTMLSLLSLEIPGEMTGKPLLKIVDSAQDAA
jgi:2,3-bisphosphoglycerate-independent phosphoglycerate mutase